MVAQRSGVMVAPAVDRWHWEPKPLLGGAGIAFAFIASLLVFCPGPLLGSSRAVWLSACAASLFLIGLVDDVVDLIPSVKFMLQLAAVATLAAWGPRFDLFNNNAANFLLTIFWLLTAANAFNFIDGLDGLAAGVGVMATIGIAVIAGLHHEDLLTTRALILGAALLAFLMYNFAPATIFMGDSGALSVGLLLGVFSIDASHAGEGSWPMRAVVPLLLMMVPLLDILTVTVTRMATGISVSHRGLDHSHHRLARLGLSDRTVVLLMYALQAIAAISAIGLSLLHWYSVVLVLPLVTLPFALVGLFLMDRTFDPEAPGELKHLPLLGRLILTCGYKRRIAEVALDAILIAAAYFGAFMLRLEFNIGFALVLDMWRSLPFVLAISYVAFFSFGIYRGIWRYAELEDVTRFGGASVFAAVMVWGASNFVNIAQSGSVVCLFGLLLFNLLAASRLSFRLFFRAIRSWARPARRVVIVGADSGAAAMLHHLFSEKRGEHLVRLLGFIDDDEFKHGKLLHGYPVLGSVADLERIFGERAFDEILVAQKVVANGSLTRVFAFAREHHLPLQRFAVDLYEFEAEAPGSEANSPTIGGKELKPFPALAVKTR
jgi:UDP-GlcNAc:undecaprenyl-phosphate GlcNAc-1-phosphate transferase